MYSTIRKKTCKHNGCPKYSPLGLSGWCWEHLPGELKEKVGNRKKVAIKNRNNRNAQMLRLKKVQNQVEGSEKWKSDLWFLARHFEMTGHCLICNGKTCKGATIFKNSICHLFAKALFPSIAWHEYNWFEGCFYGNSCHTNFDNNILTFEMIKEKNSEAWSEIVIKTKILYPLMTPQEQGRVPTILINEL